MLSHQAVPPALRLANVRRRFRQSCLDKPRPQEGRRAVRFIVTLFPLLDMSRIVQKFGGSSLATPDRIRNVASRVVGARRTGAQVMVVVSAMGNTTDELAALAWEVNSNPPAREMDMLLTAGERISIALTAMAIASHGVEAVSLTGSQAGILTDETHGAAKIQGITGSRVTDNLAEGKVVIVAGFQGVSPRSKEITTLGRGGSDTSAVALAAALGGDVAEIYTDVAGVMTADPRIVPQARKLDEVSYEVMMELAACGAGVLIPRAVEVGRRYGVPIHVRSSFTDAPGTWIRKATEMESMEQAIISAIAHDASEAKVTLREVPDQPGVAASIFEPLAAAGVNVDMIVQNVSRDGLSDVSFTIPKVSIAWAEEVVRVIGEQVQASAVEIQRDIAKVSLVGAGMKTEPGVAARVFRTLGRAGINIEMISTSTIRISCVVDQSQMNDAVQALHREFRPPLIRSERGL